MYNIFSKKTWQIKGEDIMKANKIIEKIAKERNLTPKEVEDEMRRAIREAMATKDPQAQALWKQLAPDGNEPSIDRFLEFCANKINERKGF